MDEISSFLLSIIESSSDAIIGLTLTGNIKSWNPAAEQMYDYSVDEVIDTSISIVSLPDRIDELFYILKRIANGDKINHFQTIHLTKNGYSHPVSLSISPVFNELNVIVGASLIARSLKDKLLFDQSLQQSESKYQKLKSSLKLAHKIQSTLLPSPEKFPSQVDMHAKTLYSEHIGGDYYDIFFVQGQNVLGIALGDVSGHGTPASLLMALAKGALQTSVRIAPFSLSNVMAQINQIFCHHTEDDQFMTLFLATIDLRTHELCWCSAGQGPIYIYHSELQYFQDLECTDSPLGIIPDNHFSEKRTFLNSGDLVIAGTDGLWEAQNSKGEMFSVKRFRQIMATWHQKTAKEICEKMLSRVQMFSEKNNLDDDTSLFIVKMPEPKQIKG